jgi:RimJ/RimL family protein N-acetyltransferase
MPGHDVLRTDRLVLRRWRAADRKPFAALNADPEVMAHLAGPLTRPQSDSLIEWIENEFDQRGFGLWALEVAQTGQFIGFTGLSVPRFEAPFTPAVEIGWRLSRLSWGNGYATEAAGRALAFAFESAGLTEVVSFTSRTNLRSQAVMKRIGMIHDAAGDFDRPGLVAGHPLRPHVLWRITAVHWHQQHDEGTK